MLIHSGIFFLLSQAWKYFQIWLAGQLCSMEKVFWPRHCIADVPHPPGRSLLPFSFTKQLSQELCPSVLLFGKERRVFVFLFATDFHREDSHCQKRNTKRSKLSSICRGKQRFTPEHRASITLRANMISSLPTKVTFWLTMSHMGKQEAIESLP